MTEERTEEQIEQFFDLQKEIAFTGLRIQKAFKADPEGNQDIVDAWGHLLNMHIAECELKLEGERFKDGTLPNTINRALLETKRDAHKAALETLKKKHAQTLLEDNGIECANPLCDERFIPDKRRKYHSKKCQKRAATNRYNAKKRVMLDSGGSLGAAQEEL